jgi:hypothetical protein
MIGLLYSKVVVGFRIRISTIFPLSPIVYPTSAVRSIWIAGESKAKGKFSLFPVKLCDLKAYGRVPIFLYKFVIGNLVGDNEPTFGYYRFIPAEEAMVNRQQDAVCCTE